MSLSPESGSENIISTPQEFWERIQGTRPSQLIVEDNALSFANFVLTNDVKAPKG